MTKRPYPRRRFIHEPRYGWVPVLVIALLVAVLDWSTKLIVAATVPLGHMVEVWEDRVALWHAQNPEMVLGLWGSLPLESRKVVAVVAAILAVLLVYEIVEQGHRLPVHRRPWVWLFVGLASGGMLGNLGERLIHWTVTDFLSLRWGDTWLPPANFADLAILLAIPAAVPVIIFELQARTRRERQDAVDTAQPQWEGGSLALESGLRAWLAISKGL